MEKIDEMTIQMDTDEENFSIEIENEVLDGLVNFDSDKNDSSSMFESFSTEQNAIFQQEQNISYETASVQHETLLQLENGYCEIQNAEDIPIKTSEKIEYFPKENILIDTINVPVAENIEKGSLSCYL